MNDGIGARTGIEGDFSTEALADGLNVLVWSAPILARRIQLSSGAHEWISCQFLPFRVFSSSLSVNSGLPIGAMTLNQPSTTLTCDLKNDCRAPSADRAIL